MRRGGGVLFVSLVTGEIIRKRKIEEGLNRETKPGEC